MLKIIRNTLSILFMTFIISACSESNTPELGKHFSKLPSDLTEYNLSPITEVFSLTCGHCFKMEQNIPEIEKLTNQSVGKLHVTFNKSAQVSAMFYYTAVMQLNSKPNSDFMKTLFTAIQQRDIDDDERQILIEKAFNDEGIVSPYKLSKEQSANMLQLVSDADQISREAEINAVPSFIIKGKYILNTDQHESIQELADTINFILSDSSL